MISANINYYSINQFNNPLAVKDPNSKSFGKVGKEPRAKPLLDEGRRLKSDKDPKLPDLKDLELPDRDTLDEAIPGLSDLDIPDLDGISEGLGDLDFSGITPDDLSNITADDLEALSDLDLSDLPIDFDNIPIPEKDAFSKIAVPDN